MEMIAKQLDMNLLITVEGKLFDIKLKFISRFNMVDYIDCELIRYLFIILLRLNNHISTYRRGAK